MIAHKILAFKEAAVTDGGEFTGYGAWFNNVDDGNDLIEPQFFDDAIPDFLKSGFISWGHDWDDPVAYPTKAAPDEVGLAMGATFHTTSNAQDKRTIAKERLDAGLTMGLSIGYETAAGGTKRREDGVRLLQKCSRLFEVGMVMVPMNGLAGMTGIKGGKSAVDDASDAAYIVQLLNRLIQTEAMEEDDTASLSSARDIVLSFLEEESTEIGTPEDLERAVAEAAAWAEQYYGYGYMGRGTAFAEHLKSVGLVVSSAAERAKVVSKLRKNGRALSADTRDRLEAFIKDLAAAEAEIKGLLASSAPAGQADIEFELTRARWSGVNI